MILRPVARRSRYSAHPRGGRLLSDPSHLNLQSLLFLLLSWFSQSFLLAKLLYVCTQAPSTYVHPFLLMRFVSWVCTEQSLLLFLCWHDADILFVPHRLPGAPAVFSVQSVSAGLAVFPRPNVRAPPVGCVPAEFCSARNTVVVPEASPSVLSLIVVVGKVIAQVL